MMIQTTHQTCNIQRVQKVLPCDNGTQVIFENGLSACIRTGHAEYERMVRQAHHSVQDGIPVGFLLNETAEIVELNYTHQSTVRFIRPDEDDSSRLVVAFWAYSPICYLTRDHPEFERIRQTLERAAKGNEHVILANHMNMVDGETETWWKIMDVRPA
jgi:hypothetical protein